jgi:ribonuclease HI
MILDLGFLVYEFLLRVGVRPTPLFQTRSAVEAVNNGNKRNKHSFIIHPFHRQSTAIHSHPIQSSTWGLSVLVRHRSISQMDGDDEGNRRGRHKGSTRHSGSASSFRLAVVVVMLVGSVASAAAAAVVVLQFDGSLRRCHSSSRGGGSDAWISTCAASISIDGRLHGLGGRRLLTTTTMPIQGKSSSAAGSRCSSIVAEYEGLLYGLEQLAKFLHEHHDDDDDENNNNNNSRDFINSSSTVAVLVQGDCKTVVEQMQGRARPRIMEEYHQRATAIIDQDIAPFFRGQRKQQQQSTTNNNNNNTNNTLLFQHIPRAQNALTDELADCIADQGRVAAVHEFLDHLQRRFFFVLDEEEEDTTATPSVRPLVPEDENVDDDDLLLLLLSRLDAPTQLVGLRCLAQQLLYGQHVRWKPSPPQHKNNKYDDITTADLLFGIADRIDTLLSSRNTDSQHALYHVDDQDKIDMTVRAYLCRQRALAERGDGGAIVQFQRKTRHFARTRASDIDRLVVLEETEASCSTRQMMMTTTSLRAQRKKIWLDVEAQILSAGRRHSSRAMAAAGPSAVTRRVWSLPVQRWLNDMMAATTTRTRSPTEWSHWTAFN